MQIPMMRTDRLYHVTANWLTNTQKRYTRDFLICAENKQDAEKITRNHIPNQFITTNNPTDTTDISIRVRDLGLSQKNRTYYVSPIQETTRKIADEPSILEQTATYFARLFGYEQGALASKDKLSNAQTTRLTALNTLCKDTQMFWKLAGEFLYLKNTDPSDFCRKKIEELTNTVNLDELAHEHSAPTVTPISVDTSVIIADAKKQADYIIAQAKETAKIIIDNARQTANIITTNATNVGVNNGVSIPTPPTPVQDVNDIVSDTDTQPSNTLKTSASNNDELPFGDNTDDVPVVNNKPKKTLSDTSDDTNATVPIATESDTPSETDNTSTDVSTESVDNQTENTDTKPDNTDMTIEDIEKILAEHAQEDIQKISGMARETLMIEVLENLKNLSKDEFIEMIKDTTFNFECNMTPYEYFESILTSEPEISETSETSTKAGILANIADEDDDSMLITYALSLVVATQTETPTEENINDTSNIESTTKLTETNTSESNDAFNNTDDTDDFGDFGEDPDDDDNDYSDEEPNYEDEFDGDDSDM